MDIFKTMYEIRYPVMLRFRDFYKDIINPYFIYPNTKYSVSNEGIHTESINVTFPNSKHRLYFSNDRISFRFDGSYKDLLQNGSHIEMCFDIFERLKKIDSFPKINGEILEIIGLHQIEKDRDKTLEDIAAKHNITNVGLDGADLAISFSGKKGENYKIQIDYGLFVPEKDIDAYNLFALDTSRKSEMAEKNGILVRNNILRLNTDNATKKTFRKLTELAENLTSNIIAHYGA